MVLGQHILLRQSDELCEHDVGSVATFSFSHIQRRHWRRQYSHERPIGDMHHFRAGVWLTNVVVRVTNGTVSLSFTVSGGSNSTPYDVFANSILDFSNTTNHPWAWMGQVYHCTNYTLPNLTNGAVYLILGTPRDDDQDGLTDAYEMLVSKTNPNAASTLNDGILDGWKVVWGMNPLEDNASL